LALLGIASGPNNSAYKIPSKTQWHRYIHLKQYKFIHLGNRDFLLQTYSIDLKNNMTMIWETEISHRLPCHMGTIHNSMKNNFLTSLNKRQMRTVSK
jgi:hypothetical protein